MLLRPARAASLQGIPHQQRALAVHHLVAHMGADPKARAFAGALHQHAPLQSHHHASHRAHGFHGEIQNQVEQIFERQMRGQFPPRPDQRFDRAPGPSGLARLLSDAFHARCHVGLFRRPGIRVHEQDGVLLGGRLLLFGVGEFQLAHQHPVVGPQRVRLQGSLAVDVDAVGAAQVAHDPTRALALQHQVLARYAHHVGVAQFVAARPPQTVRVPLQGNQVGSAVGSPDRER